MYYRIKPIITLSICCIFSCIAGKVSIFAQTSVSKLLPTTHHFISDNGDTIPTGKATPVTTSLRSTTFVKPRVLSLPNNRKTVPARPHILPAGNPEVVQIPAELRVFTPGTNGLPIPDTLPAYVTVIPAVYSKPYNPAIMQMRDNAVTNIQYLSVEEGLTNNIIRCILEDSRGNIWFGSRDETLTRYDGKTLTFFHNPEENPEHGFTHLSLLEDKHGHIWFGTRTGLGRFDGHQFTYFTNDKSNLYNGVTRLIIDRHGNIWFGTRKQGVGRFDGHSFVHYSTQQGLSHNQVTALLEDKHGNLWFGTNGGGVNRFDGNAFAHLTDREGLCDNHISTIIEDHEGQLWFGTQRSGACRFELQGNVGTFTTYAMEEGLSSNVVLGLCEDSEGQIWFGTNFMPLILFDGKTFVHYNEENGMNSTNAHAIMEDSYGNIWVGTNKGVHRFGLPKFQHFTEEISYSVNDISEDLHGRIWFGVSGNWPNGVIRYDDDSLRFFTGNDHGLDFLNAGIHALTVDEQGMLWLGSSNQGVARFNPDIDPDHLMQFDIGAGINNFLISMMEDSRGDLWFGTLHGFAHFDGKNLTSYITPAGPGVEFNFAGPFIEDGDQDIFFGHVQYLGKLDRATVDRSERDSITYFTKHEGLPHSLVVDIKKDQEGRLWIGTEGGLSQYDGENFINFTPEDGLVHRKIYSLVIDSAQNIWAGTQNGLSLLMPVKTSDSTSHEIYSKGYKIFNFGKEDGLKHADFLYHCSHLDSKNRIWWGKTKGVMMLDLNDFKAAQKPPKVNLDYLDVNQQFVDYRRLSDITYSLSFSFGEKLSASFDSIAPFRNYPLNPKLPYKLNHLTFHFSGIDWACSPSAQVQLLVGRLR